MVKKQVIDDKAKLAELTADLQRLQADFINYRRRSDEEQMQLMAVAKEQVILQLLPLLDNIQRLFTHLPADLKDNPWAVGVAKVGEQVKGSLKELGVEPIEAVSKEFDPNLHEAVNFEDGVGRHEVVTQELQTGYKIGGRVIRPAIVKVAKHDVKPKHINKEG